MIDRWIVPYCLALLACGDGERTAPPDLRDVSVTTPEDTQVAVVFTLTAAVPGAVTFTVVTPPSHGTFTGDGPTYNYKPAANYAGADSMVVRAADAYGSSMATATITVGGVNDAPVVTASAGAVAYLENAAAVVLDPDLSVSDVDSLTLAGARVQIETGCTSPQDVLALAAPPAGVTVAGYDASSCTLSLTGAASLATYREALRLVAYVNTSDAPSSAARSLRFTVDDGESASNTGSATRDLTVTAEDDTPLAIDDAAVVAEDSSATAIAVLANDLDLDGGPIAISEVTQPAHGAVVLAGDGSGVTYTPNANDCNAGGASDTFTYTLSPGGSSATVTVTVTCADDAPVAVDDSATVAEASLANLIDVVANDTDIDGGPRTVASVTQPGHGSAAVGPEGANVTYTPAAGYCNQIPNGSRDIFTYTLTGGSSATVSVQVTCACGLNRSTDFVVGSN